MDLIEKLWPIIQTGGAVAAVLMLVWLRDLKRDRDSIVLKHDQCMAKYIELSGEAIKVIERSAANTAAQSTLIARVLEDYRRMP